MFGLVFYVNNQVEHYVYWAAMKYTVTVQFMFR